MVLNTVILWDLGPRDEPLLELARDAAGPGRVEWIVLEERRLRMLDTGEVVEFGAAGSSRLAQGLNLAIRKAAGRNLIVLGSISEAFSKHLPEVEDFLAKGGACIGVGPGSDRESLGIHRERCGGFSALPFLFATSGTFCARRSNFSARDPFDPELDGAELWLEFVHGHLVRCAQASGGKDRNYWSNAAFLPGLADMARDVPRSPLSPEQWQRFVGRRDLLELHLANSLVRAHLSSTTDDPRARVERLGRIEAILRCSKDLIPTRESFSFLLEDRQ